MAIKFTKATREKLKLRMALDGPAGSGKTYNGLRFAFALGQRVAVIDTESGSARKYTGESPDGVPFDFDVIELTRFSPSEYTACIREASRAGYDVLLIDSLSHAWDGKDGALDLVDKKSGSNKFTAWKDVTPMHREMVDAILVAPLHVIATMRSKTEYVIETDERGRSVPRKVGMAPIQRPGMEYEFDVYGSLDQSHVLTISKSRCSAIADAVVVKPSATFMLPVIDWLQRGTPAAATPVALIEARDRVVGLAGALGVSEDQLRQRMIELYQVNAVTALTYEQAVDLGDRMEAAKQKRNASRTSEGVPQQGTKS